MKGLVCILLLLETFVFVVQQQVDGGINENEISQQISSEDGRQNPPQTDTSTDRQQYCHLCFPDIHAALRELTATVSEQRANNRALETQQTFILEEMKKKNDEISNLKSQVEELRKETREISNLTLSQVAELRKGNRDREIAFSAALMQSGSGYVGPFTSEITLTYRNVFSNIGNAYNPITGIFTAPLKGVYLFRISAHCHGGTASAVSITKNGERVVMASADLPQGNLNTSNGVVLVLEVGDVVYVRLWANRRIYDSDNNHSTFSGYLLFPLREPEPCRM